MIYILKGIVVISVLFILYYTGFLNNDYLDLDTISLDERERNIIIWFSILAGTIFFINKLY